MKTDIGASRMTELPREPVVPVIPPAIFVFDTHAHAEALILALSRSGFDMKKLSLVGRGYHSEEHPVGFYTLGDRVRAWGKAGAFWGGIWGILLAPAVFMLPGLGMVLMAGPVVAALVGGLEGAVVVGGLSALGAALSATGMAHEDILRYETALKADKYVLTVQGSPDDTERVRAILEQARQGSAA